MLSLFPQLLDYQFYAPTILRLALAVIFLAHGWQKVKSDKVKFAGWLETMKFKHGRFWAWVVTIIEIIGGICLLLGFATQLVALILAIQMLLILFWFKKGQSFVGGKELDFLILMALLALLILGPGAWAIDKPF